jgi:hypothetical protein
MEQTELFWNLVKKFLACYGTRRFITVFIKGRKWSLISVLVFALCVVITVAMVMLLRGFGPCGII